MVKDINTEIGNKQDTLTNALNAGDNISITSDGVISSTDTNTTYTAKLNGSLVLNGTEFSLDLTNIGASSTYTFPRDVFVDSSKKLRAGALEYYKSSVIKDVSTEIDNKQDILTDALNAGNNISITSGVITSTDTNTTYTAKLNGSLVLNGTEFSLDLTNIGTNSAYAFPRDVFVVSTKKLRAGALEYYKSSSIMDVSTEIDKKADLFVIDSGSSSQLAFSTNNDGAGAYKTLKATLSSSISNGDNGLPTSDQVFDYLKTNYQYQIVNNSTSQLTIGDDGTTPNINNVLTIRLATDATSAQLGVVTGALLKTKLDTIRIAGTQVSSGTIDDARLPTTVSKRIIESNVRPQLTVQPAASTGTNAVIEIIGARNSSTAEINSQLIFRNSDIDSNSGSTVGTKSFGLIGGRTQNTTLNTGGLLFQNFADGSTASVCGTMTSTGNWHFGNAVDYQTTHNLKVTGSSNFVGTHTQTGDLTTTTVLRCSDVAATNDVRADADIIAQGTMVAESRVGISAAGRLSAPNISPSADDGQITVYTGRADESTRLFIMASMDDPNQGDEKFCEVLTDKITTRSLEIYETGVTVASTAGNVALRVSSGCSIFGNNSGNGINSANGMLQVNSINSNAMVDGACFRPCTNNNHIINFVSAGNSLRGKIKGNGSNGVQYQTSSDRRLKSDIVDVPSYWELVKNLNTRSFRWKDCGLEAVGFIAQEVFAQPEMKELKPKFEYGDYYQCDISCCEFDETGYCENPIVDMSTNEIYPHALDYGQFTPYLWNALQEAIVRIEKLEDKIKEMSK